MRLPLLLFNLGAQELLVLLMLGMLGLGVMVAIALTFFLASRSQGSRDDDGD
jgi:hypothetical protein